jgi:flagellar biosynthesis/type III secretory pathway M-ring protein FliF/YscJ
MSSGPYNKKSAKSEKRRDLEQKLLDTLRKTRAKIDPALLEKVRVATQAQVDMRQEQKIEEDFEPVDKRKMYETILRFVHINQGKQEFMKEVMAMLQGNSPGGGKTH